MLRRLVITLILFFPLFSFASYTPNEPLISEQWYLDTIRAKEAWSITQGSPTVKIAILDSSPMNHTDMPWDALGYDALTDTIGAERYINVPSNSPYYNYWHGLHVAAIAGAPFNGEGTAGICPDCTIVPINITNASGKPDLALIENGVDWAITNNIDIINMSFSSPPNAPCSTMEADSVYYPLKIKIEEAIGKGIIVVAAAGNAEHGTTATNVFPVSCTGVIGVSATNRNKQRPEYSNFGQGTTIGAPGGTTAGFGEQYSPSGSNSCTRLSTPHQGFINNDAILSAWANIADGNPQSCYRYGGGTSMAAPMVSGTAGLILSVNKNISPEKVRKLLTENADTIENAPRNYNYFLNVEASVSAALSSTTGPCSLKPTSSSTCTIDEITEYKNSNGDIDKLIYAYGHKWHLNGSNAFKSKVGRTDLDPTYNHVNGPCENVSSGKCKIDTITTVNYPGTGYVKSITAYGKGWNYDAAGNLWGQNPLNLKDVPRFRDGPCVFAGTQKCTFDTRVLVDLPGSGMVEAITAYGHYFLYSSGALVASGNNIDIARWATGPCSSVVGNGQNCKFDARNVVVDRYGNVIETVIAYGRLYEWKNNNLTRNVKLTSDSVYK